MKVQFKNPTDLAIRLDEIDTALRDLSARRAPLAQLDAETERLLDERDAVIDEIDAMPLKTVADAAAKLAAVASIHPDFFADDLTTDGRLMRQIVAGLASLRSA